MIDQTFVKKQNSPFFLYDLDAMETHLRSIQKMSGERIRLFYATKANPLSDILRLVNCCGFGIDVASLGELHQAKTAGFSEDETVATGPAKSKDYIRTLVESGLHTLVLESPNQARWASDVAIEKEIEIDCLIRVQLEWQEGSSVLGGNEVTPFGLGKEDWDLNELQTLKNLNYKGYHVFQWGNLTDTNKICETWNQIIEQICDYNQELQIQEPIIDLGGGLGLDYSQTHVESSMSSLNLETLFSFLNEKVKAKNLGEIWLELGRYAVGAFGHYFHRIVDMKNNRGINQLVCESGINHLIRPPLTDCPFPATVMGKESEEAEYNVHGPLCTALDKLGTYKFSKNVEIGDWIHYRLVGAYGMTESMPYFLCHHLPAEFIKKNGEIICVRESEPPQIWMK